MVVFIRGDLEINETKLVNYLKDEIHPAIITEECGLNAGYIGPVGLKINGDAIVLYDRSLENRNNLSCGANEDEYHYKGLNMQRDVPDAEYHDFQRHMRAVSARNAEKRRSVFPEESRSETSSSLEINIRKP